MYSRECCVNLILFLSLLQTFATAQHCSWCSLQACYHPRKHLTNHPFSPSQQLKQKTMKSLCEYLANLNVISPLNLFLFLLLTPLSSVMCPMEHLTHIFPLTFFTWCLTSYIHCHTLASKQCVVLPQLAFCGPSWTRMLLTEAAIANAQKYTVTRPHSFLPFQALMLGVITSMLPC